MGYNIVKGGKDWWFIAGRGHSWGSFKSWSEANAFIKQVEADDKAYREKFARQRAESFRKIDQEEANWQAAKRARLESNRLLYEGCNGEGQ